jgi:hypothetical protein
VLEQAVEEQGDALALKLRLALLAYEQNRPRHRHSGDDSNGRHRRSKSRSSAGVSPSSSVSTSASTSSSASFPASPQTQLSPIALQTLRENEALRVRLANSERVNAYYQRELAELRRRCGISISELEELELSGNEEPVASGSGSNGTRSRQRSLSYRSDWGASPPASVGTGSIRIPGASSASPPAARLSTSSFPFSTSVNSRLQPQSYTSYTSSVGTAITTPSSSYPIARAPAPTPAGSNAFSPVSARSVSSSGFAGRRNSLSVLVSAALAEVQREQDSVEAATSPSVDSRGGIDLDDLLHITSTTSAPTSHSSGSSSLSTSAFPPGSALHSSTTSASSSFVSTSHLASSDPLVAAITRSLAKLASADALGNERRPLLHDDGEYEEELDSGSSSTTSREGTDGEPGAVGVEAVPATSAGGARVGGGQDEDGGETPLSISPGSRSGSLSRKASTNARARFSCGGVGRRREAS